MFKPAAALLVLIAAITLWWFNFGRYNSSERDLFARVEAVTSTGSQPSAAEITHEFGLASQCASKSCFFGGQSIANASYARGNLRPTNDGLVFELDELSGQCVRADMAARRFGGEIGQRCVDSECWYLEAQHDWGIVGFGLKKPNSTCVSSVVINSLDVARPRPSRVPS